MGSAESEPIRVLVVDDDAALAELTATFLERHGIRAETATSATAGLRRLGLADTGENHDTDGRHDDERGRGEPGPVANGDRQAHADGGSTGRPDHGVDVDHGPSLDLTHGPDLAPGPKPDSIPDREDDRDGTGSDGAESSGDGTDSHARIDCVVSDQDMPDMTGIAFLRAVREADPELPFVLFTGKGSEEIASAAISAGVSEYLRKEHGTKQYAVLANRIRTVVARHRGERALREERAFTESTFDATPMSVYAFDGGGQMVRWNDRFAAVTGYDDAEIAAMNCLEFIPSAQHEWMTEQIGRVLAGEVITIESGFRTREGGVVPQEFRAARITDSDGAVVGLVGTGRDLTEHKEYERDLAEERNRLAALFENATDCIAETEFVGGEPIIRRVNAAFETRFGYDESEVIGRSLDALLVPGDRRGEATEINARAGTGTVEDEVCRRTADGIREFLLRDVPLEAGGENGDGRRAYAVYTDVTERRERERELREQKAFVESVFQAIPDVFFIIDDRGELLRWNDRATELTGYTDAEIAEMAPIEFVAEKDRDEIVEAIATVFSEGGVETREAAYLTKGGQRIPHEFNGTRVTDEDGTLLGLVGIGRDLTERLEHERMLERQNDRLEEFASVLSHDLRNPLGVATGYLDLARETGAADDFERVERAHDRIERLIERILAEARYGRVVTDLEAVSLAVASEAAFATVDTDGATLDVESAISVVADDERLRQVLENLFRNSVEHGGSEVTIEVDALPNGFFVADDGPGIDPSNREAVFEYGYTAAAEGTGFGLAIVARIAEAHGWEIRATESDHGGARFEITGVEVV